MKISLDYAFGDVVYLRLRLEKIPGMVTGMYLRPTGNSFIICWGKDANETTHYAFELTREFVPDYLAAND
jgi:hypothetical protein